MVDKIASLLTNLILWLMQMPLFVPLEESTCKSLWWKKRNQSCHNANIYWFIPLIYSQILKPQIYHRHEWSVCYTKEKNYCICIIMQNPWNISNVICYLLWILQFWSNIIEIASNVLDHLCIIRHSTCSKENPIKINHNWILKFTAQ